MVVRWGLWWCCCYFRVGEVLCMLGFPSPKVMRRVLWRRVGEGFLLRSLLWIRTPFVFRTLACRTRSDVEVYRFSPLEMWDSMSILLDGYAYKLRGGVVRIP